MYTRSLPHSDARARAYGRIRSGDITDSSAWRTGKPAIDELYGDACHAATRFSPAREPRDGYLQRASAGDAVERLQG